MKLSIVLLVVALIASSYAKPGIPFYVDVQRHLTCVADVVDHLTTENNLKSIWDEYREDFLNNLVEHKNCTQIQSKSGHPELTEILIQSCHTAKYFHSESILDKLYSDLKRVSFNAYATVFGAVGQCYPV